VSQPRVRIVGTAEPVSGVTRDVGEQSAAHLVSAGRAGSSSRQPPPAGKEVGAGGFTGDRLARIAGLERWHFWFAGRRALVDRLLARYIRSETGPILDLGCGTGSMLVRLARGPAPA